MGRHHCVLTFVHSQQQEPEPLENQLVVIGLETCHPGPLPITTGRLGAVRICMQHEVQVQVEPGGEAYLGRSIYEAVAS